MDAIDRRSALRTLMCGAVAAGLGASLLPDLAEATPLAMQKDPGRGTGDLRQQAQSGARRDGLPIHDLPTATATAVAVGSVGGSVAAAGAAGDGYDGIRRHQGVKRGE